MIENTHRVAALAVQLTATPALNLHRAMIEHGVYDHLATMGLAVHTPNGWVVTKEGEAWLRQVVG